MSRHVARSLCGTAVLTLLLIAGWRGYSAIASIPFCVGMRAGVPGDCVAEQPCGNALTDAACGGFQAKEAVQKLPLDCVPAAQYNCAGITRQCYTEYSCKWDITANPIVCVEDQAMQIHNILAKTSVACQPLKDPTP